MVRTYFILRAACCVVQDLTLIHVVFTHYSIPILAQLMPHNGISRSSHHSGLVVMASSC
jgi:hypothetical protein